MVVRVRQRRLKWPLNWGAAAAVAAVAGAIFTYNTINPDQKKSINYSAVCWIPALDERLRMCSDTSRVAKAKNLLLQGRFDEARADFQDAVTINPDNAEAYWGLSRVDSNNGDFEQAIKEIDRAIELDPDNFQFFVDRILDEGIEPSPIENREKFKQDLGKLLILAPRSKMTGLIRDIFEHGVQNETVGRDLDELILEDPHNEGLRLASCGRFFLVAMPKEGASECFEAQKLSTSDPSPAILVCLNAKYLPACDHAFSINPGSPLAHAAKAAALLTLIKSSHNGNILEGTENLKGSIDESTNAINMNAKECLAYDARALAEALQNRSEPAAQDADKAVACNPKWGLSYYTRAVVPYMSFLMSRNIEKKSIDGIISDLAIMRTSVNVPVSMFDECGDMLRNLKSFEDASSCYREALNINASDLNAIKGLEKSRKGIDDLPAQFK